MQKVVKVSIVGVKQWPSNFSQSLISPFFLNGGVSGQFMKQFGNKTALISAIYVPQELG